MNPIILKFMIEKREGLGEDSNTLSIVKDDFCAVGVFDGMGGSGAAICKSEFGDDHTKAYVASRIILEAINNYIENTKDVRSINSDGIRFTARGRLEQEKNTYPTKASGLRSKLVRDYPTTLAITTALKNEDETYVVNSYWAGDSRNYLWTQEGFCQISKDDLDTELDPLENLRNDGILSNCICADREFCINNLTIEVPEKFVILSATDGCFNYFATPMHFQEVLLTGLRLSENEEEWADFCKEEFSAVTGDDVSISLLAIGFESFTDLKETFMSSTVTGIEKIKSAQDEIKHLTSKLDSAKENLEALIQSEWEVYKVSYMKYFTQEESSEECKETNVPEEPESTKSNDEEAVNEVVINTSSEGEEKESTDNDKVDLPLSTEKTVESECLTKEDLDSPIEEVVQKKESEVQEAEVPVIITEADDSMESKSVSTTESEIVSTSVPKIKEDTGKNGRAPIRLSAPSVSSPKLKNTFHKSEGSVKQKTDKFLDSSSEHASSLMTDFFSINTFDEALTYFQTRIEHSGLPKDAKDAALYFLSALKNR